MRKTIKLPAPELSQLKEVDIDLDMTGRHYATLATSEGQIAEDVAFGILKDLIEQDANKLTLPELRYLFMLVKINAMENSYFVDVACTHTNKKGEVCGFVNNFEVKLSDADLNRTPHGYKVPEIEFVTLEGKEKKYLVMPPTMDMESALLNWFLVEKNHTVEEIAENAQDALSFSFIRSLMHLIDENGNRLISEINQFETADKYFDCNKFTTVKKLYEYCTQVDSFGVQDKTYEFKCKECGGRIVFRLPLLNGLVD